MIRKPTPSTASTKPVQKSANAKPVQKPAAVAKPAPATGKDILKIDIDRQAIKKKAEEIAAWKNSYDISIWLFAEAEMKLADAYVTVLDGTNPTVMISKSKIVDKPGHDAIESLAKAIYAKRPKVEELNWFLAERRYIFDKVKGKQ
ncbi:MAG TPA: hypothetical protein VKM55_18235 [Candidatus Lokiarchaeia archaeon]|nr:hypothetical protein [Candidatus Lokiarchaeia archaeon]